MIPARGGSKRIPYKNIKRIDGADQFSKNEVVAKIANNIEALNARN